LSFDSLALEKIVDNCLKLKTGARGLHTEIERALIPHMFQISNYKKNGINKINISQELIDRPKSIL